MEVSNRRVIRVIFTVDVEGHIGQDPVNRLIYGITNNERRCGIDLLMDLLDRYGVKGLFFVDIAEAWDYGEKKVADVLRHITRRGHFTGVHIHPDHMADPNRRFLHEYSWAEQYDIISNCTDLYERALGRRPEVFRAGRYGADRNTLKILTELGYKADFSQFFGKRDCHIIPPCAVIKPKRQRDGLLEVPVTVFRSFKSPLYSRIDKIDASQTYPEYRMIMDKLKKEEYCDTVVLFAHSFSLLNWRNRPDAPSFSYSKYRRLWRQIEYVINTPEYRFTDMNELIVDLRDTLNNAVEDAAYEPIPELDRFMRFPGLLYRTVMVLKARMDINLREWK